MSELRPCPFCSCSMKLEPFTTALGVKMVHSGDWSCLGRLATDKLIPYGKVGEFMDRWNHRGYLSDRPQIRPLNIDGWVHFKNFSVLPCPKCGSTDLVYFPQDWDDENDYEPYMRCQMCGHTAVTSDEWNKIE